VRRLARSALAEVDLIQVPFRHCAEAVRRAIPSARRPQDLVRARELIARSDVVSFDVYDTLVQRRLLLPTDIHLVVGATATECGLVRTPSHWADIRERAEAVARSSARGPDVTLAEIYEQLNSMFSADRLLTLQDRELEAEISLTRPTARGLALWSWAQEASATIVVTSDIYLPSDALASILTRSGYAGWARIYVSGDAGIAKFDGTAFRRVREDFPGRRILHLGDNPHSDVARARAAGITALQIRRPFDAHSPTSSGLPREVDPRPADVAQRRRGPRESRELEVSLVSGLIEDRLDRRSGTADALDEIGYAVLGPALVGFVQYLHEAAGQAGIDRLLFLAREGLILQHAYQTLYAETAIDNDYAILSTRTLGLAELDDPLSPESLRFLTKTSAPVTPVDYLRRVLPVLAPDRVAAECRRAGIDPRHRMTFGEARQRLRPLFEAFAADLTEVGRAAKPVLQSYLRRLDTGSTGTAIVDSGWAGTIQGALNRITDRAHTGFYVALSDTPVTRTMTGLHAMLDERHGGIAARDFRRVYRRTPALEILLANPDSGSLASIAPAAENDVEPFRLAFLPNEFGSADQETVRSLQTSAIEFVGDFAASSLELPAAFRNIPRGAALGPLLEFLTAPSLTQLSALSRVRFDGSYGVRPSRLGAWWIPTALRRR
jgi:FMN phosphatase YigB (HAD superfamily)